MDCSPPGSSVHGISQTRILEWVVIHFIYDIQEDINRNILITRNLHTPLENKTSNGQKIFLNINMYKCIVLLFVCNKISCVPCWIKGFELIYCKGLCQIIVQTIVITVLLAYCIITKSECYPSSVIFINITVEKWYFIALNHISLTMNIFHVSDSFYKYVLLIYLSLPSNNV